MPSTDSKLREMLSELGIWILVSIWTPHAYINQRAASFIQNIYLIAFRMIAFESYVTPSEGSDFHFFFFAFFINFISISIVNFIMLFLSVWVIVTILVSEFLLKIHFQFLFQLFLLMNLCIWCWPPNLSS